LSVAVFLGRNAIEEIVERHLHNPNELSLAPLKKGLFSEGKGCMLCARFARTTYGTRFLSTALFQGSHHLVRKNHILFVHLENRSLPETVYSTT
jgi:hypothetical protein